MTKGESFETAVLDTCVLEELHMHNETKVNTNSGDVTSPDAKKALLTLNCVGSIDTPFGLQFINRGEALDHAHMRSAQLASLMTLMYGEGLDRFCTLARSTQDSLVGLSIQLAEETGAMFDIVAQDLAGGQQ